MTTDFLPDNSAEPRPEEASNTGRGDAPAKAAVRVLRAGVTEKPLEPMLAAARSEMMTCAMGALVVFDGVVRNHDGGRDVAGLSYTAHPSAGESLREVLVEVASRNPGARLWAVHRVGEIPIGESALTVLAASVHRGDAFRACEEAADEIKVRVPIWKEQRFCDGGVEWVGL